MVWDSIAENVNDADVLGVPPESIGRLEYATVGWDEDGASTTAHYDLGSSGNDGNTLVKVQLFRGKAPGTPVTPGKAQGHKVVAQLSSLTGWRIPAPGTRVLVAWPGGAENQPGAAVILATLEQSPTTQYAADRVVMDYGPNTHVVIKAKSVTLQENNAGGAGPFAFIGVGTPYVGGARGIRAVNYDGCGWTVESGAVGIFASSGGDAKSVINLSATEIDLLQKDGSFLKLAGGNFQSFGAVNKMQGSGCYIGAAPLAAQVALFGNPASPTPSASVFLSA